VVHVTEGTIFTREPRLLRAAIAGLSASPVQLIASTGRHRAVADLDLGPISPNTRVEQFVPHRELFEKTDVVVTNGGAGTVTTALVAGVPLVIVPNAWELAENAQRVAECGAGLRLTPDRCTPSRLARAVERVLEDPSFRENAARVGEDLVSQGGPDRAVELLQGLVAGPGRSK
jgi:MGT family glycosyltransferase